MSSSYQYQQRQPASPKLHSLPDNSLNPLGLLAEASLANRRAMANYPSSLVARSTDSNEARQVGVASDNYFKPGPMTILPLRRLFIERQIQPEMYELNLRLLIVNAKIVLFGRLSFVDTDDVLALFNM